MNTAPFIDWLSAGEQSPATFLALVRKAYPALLDPTAEQAGCQ